MTAETLEAALNAAKQEWFVVALNERYPHTSEVTEKLDKLERTIAELKSSNPS